MCTSVKTILESSSARPITSSSTTTFPPHHSQYDYQQTYYTNKSNHNHNDNNNMMLSSSMPHHPHPYPHLFQDQELSKVIVVASYSNKLNNNDSCRVLMNQQAQPPPPESQMNSSSCSVASAITTSSSLGSNSNEQQNDSAASSSSTSSSSFNSSKKKKKGKKNNKEEKYHVIVQHRYHDHADEVPPPPESTPSAAQDGEGPSPTVVEDVCTLAKRMISSNPQSVPFPLKLYEMLNTAETEGWEDIVAWQPHGRCFIVHKPKEFTELLPRYFKLSKLASFQRQLNLYGFNRLTRGRDRSAYYHELFLRGRAFLMDRMTRVKIKGTGIRGRSNPDQEPDFWNMKWVDGVQKSTTTTMEEEDEEDEEEEDEENNMNTTTTTSPTTAVIAAPATNEKQQQQQNQPSSIITAKAQEPIETPSGITPYHHQHDAPKTTSVTRGVSSSPTISDLSRNSTTSAAAGCATAAAVGVYPANPSTFLAIPSSSPSFPMPMRLEPSAISQVQHHQQHQHLQSSRQVSHGTASSEGCYSNHYHPNCNSNTGKLLSPFTSLVDVMPHAFSGPSLPHLDMTDIDCDDDLVLSGWGLPFRYIDSEDIPAVVTTTTGGGAPPSTAGTSNSTNTLRRVANEEFQHCDLFDDSLDDLFKNDKVLNQLMEVFEDH